MAHSNQKLKKLITEEESKELKRLKAKLENKYSGIYLKIQKVMFPISLVIFLYTSTFVFLKISDLALYGSIVNEPPTNDLANFINSFYDNSIYLPVILSYLIIQIPSLFYILKDTYYSSKYSKIIKKITERRNTHYIHHIKTAQQSQP